MNHTGTLYVVATPIGNLSDISERAKATLAGVDLIAAEDTRHSQRLLNSIGISTPCMALHDHNEESRIQRLQEKLQSGQDIALISDAGTPLISDPGYKLVHHLKLAGVKVVPIPGPCAVIAALSAAGLPTDQFVFRGFLPAKTQGRQALLAQVQHSDITTVFYESSHRILACLADASTVLGPHWPMSLAKEISKTFEHIELGTIESVQAWLGGEVARAKGEFVLIFGPALLPAKDDLSESALAMLAILQRELPLKQAVKLVAEITGESKNALYQRAVKQAND